MAFPTAFYFLKAERNRLDTDFDCAVTFFFKQSRLMMCVRQLILYELTECCVIQIGCSMTCYKQT